jgi:hypothetical protein
MEIRVSTRRGGNSPRFESLLEETSRRPFDDAALPLSGLSAYRPITDQKADEFHERFGSVAIN